MLDVSCRAGNRAALPAEGLLENAARFSTGWPSTLRLPSARQAGFTLVELVLVIALSAVVAVMVSSVLSRPLEGFAAQSGRAELVDIGAIALNRMQRDIRMAVSGSLRVSPDKQGLELLLLNNAGLYRFNLKSNGLSFSATPNADCIGPTDITSGQPRCDVLQVVDPAWQPPGAGWLVAAISNEKLTWGDGSSGQILPWRKFNRLPDDAAFPGISLIELDIAPSNPDLAFGSLPESKRIYFADRVVGYRCQDGKLLRYEKQESLHESLGNGLPAGVSAHVQAGHVRDCHFEHDEISAAQATLRLNIAQLDQPDEAIRLVQFVKVNNAP
jgi:MSHA biogenesis protein MshO